MHWIIIAIYLFLLSFVLLYSTVQLITTISYLKIKRNPTKDEKMESYPFITIQLPIYNEKYVVKRLIKQMASLDYPHDRFEIQILDDSSDETSGLIKDTINTLEGRTPEIYHIQRENRVDFKAGALKYGLETAKGEFIAIFDADFIPRKDFLLKVTPHFKIKDVGVVQTRWGHLNEDYSLLTKLQSYALNAHFTIEQSGRSEHGHFINFNGTAGVWRKETIEDAGGWEGDTLTEDLDLSYRAQIKKWKIKYLEDVVSPAELPAEMNALKTQQFRWAKGAAECTKKNLWKVLRNSEIKFSTKFHAVFHLLNSFNWVCLFFSSFFLMPFQWVLGNHPHLQNYAAILLLYNLSLLFLFFFYAVANSSANDEKWTSQIKFVFQYPIFIMLSLGISLYNAIGVIEGYLGKKSSFVRTPKFNIVSENGNISSKSYVKMSFNFITVLELLATIYFGVTVYYVTITQNYFALPFALLMFLGGGAVFFLSTFHYYKAKSN